jgi:hypothetical protein
MLERITDAAIRLFWHRAPRAVGAVSPALGWLLVSDRWLLAWRWLAALAPTVAFALGVLTGLGQAGAVYTSSLLVLFLLVAVGAAGPTSGLWFLAGFLPMNLLVRPGSWSPQISHLGLVVADLVLVLLLVVIAASAVRLGRQLTLWWSAGQAQGSRSPRAGGSAAVEILGNGVAYAMLTWAWLKSVPAFIRPVYTWVGSPPDTLVVAPVQENVLLLTLGAGLAAIAVAWIGSRAPGLAVTPVAPDRDPRELPAWAAVPLLAALGVLIAAGLLSTFWEALALFAVLVLGQVVQRRVGRSARWFRQVRRLPDAVRLLVVLVVTGVIGTRVLAPWFRGTRFADSLLPVLLVTMLGLALIAVAMPQRERSALEEEPE